MTITVGTDTYLSVAGADTYWAARNNTTWSGSTTAEKEAALIEATQYIDGNYLFIGELTSLTQSLAFPRNGVYITTGNFAGADYDSDEIPPQIEKATAELALEALSARLVPVLERGGLIKKEKVDVIEVEYLDFAPAQKTFEFVTSILRPLLRNGGQTKLVRV